jgi:hypothetical protein
MIGNLDNFQLGMGLKAVLGDVIPAKNALGYSFGDFSDVTGGNKFIFLGLAVLILFIFLK